MITLSAPDEALAGSRYCVNVTGFSGSVHARATLDGVEVPVAIMIENGVAEICLKLPDNSRGAGLRIKVADSKGNDKTHNDFVI